MGTETKQIAMEAPGKNKSVQHCNSAAVLAKTKHSEEKTVILKQVKIPSLFQLAAICVISKSIKLSNMASCSLTLPEKPLKHEFLLSLSFILCTSLWHPLPATSTILLFH